jgi:hypothetical protein
MSAWSWVLSRQLYVHRHHLLSWSVESSPHQLKCIYNTVIRSFEGWHGLKLKSMRYAAIAMRMCFSGILCIYDVTCIGLMLWFSLLDLPSGMSILKYKAPQLCLFVWGSGISSTIGYTDMTHLFKSHTRRQTLVATSYFLAVGWTLYSVPYCQ